ncbi:MAG: RHS repeat-associated core domain-containing protein, partial [Pseudomonadota bacterium]
MGVSDDPAGFPFRFTGQKLDPETGLYYYKARYYDAETGRFLQTDPIGYADQMNLYGYGPNDPLNGRDVTGMIWGKALRLGAKTVKYRGNVMKAVRETAVEISNAAGTLTDEQLNEADAVAIFELFSPVSSREIAGGARRAARAIGRRGGRGRQSAGYDDDYDAPTGFGLKTIDTVAAFILSTSLMGALSGAAA